MYYCMVWDLGLVQMFESQFLLVDRFYIVIEEKVFVGFFVVVELEWIVGGLYEFVMIDDLIMDEFFCFEFGCLLVYYDSLVV